MAPRSAKNLKKRNNEKRNNQKMMCSYALLEQAAERQETTPDPVVKKVKLRLPITWTENYIK